ncbi:hypothetical protein BSKO_13471 [Bryopsis sp. KO-2023]|nr:hypothetical protein BSKO_13471 [Bryopsis sp. KO-2023]
MARSIFLVIISVGFFSLASEAQLIHDGPGLVEGCKTFDSLEFIQPYNKSEEKMLTEAYFGEKKGSGKNVTVVFAQRGSCLDYKGCFRASGSTFTLCSAFSTITHCMGFEGWPALVFDNCTKSHCEFVMPPKAAKCLYSDWRGLDPFHKVPGTCLADTEDVLLGVTTLRNLRAFNGSHCMIPLPRGATVLKQMECRDPGNEPWMRWWFDFLRPISNEPFACLWLSRCKTLDDPMDFICIQGGKDDVKVLRRLARRAFKEAVKIEAEKNASMSDLHDNPLSMDEKEKNGSALSFSPKKTIIVFVFAVVSFLL